MNIEQQLYNLKMKVLTLDDIPEHLKVMLANDIHLIESSIKSKNNEVLNLVSHCPLCNSDNLHQYKLHHIHCKDCNNDFDKSCG